MEVIQKQKQAFRLTTSEIEILKALVDIVWDGGGK